MFVHLARTHLVTEAFCVATHRHLAVTHPLFVLLKPHFEGLLYINDQAAKGLLPPNGFIDVMFAAPIETTQAAVGKNRLAFDFYASMLPVDLQTRNMMNSNVLPDFAYRDDGLLVWNAIANWTRDYVNVYYSSDSDVINDTELTAWTNDVITNGKIGGFKAITSRQQLADVLTMIIFTASAQHAVVNFPQPEQFTYAPAVSPTAYAPAPQANVVYTQADWQKMMPPMMSAYEKVVIYHLLGAIYHGKLGQYNSAVYPHAPLFNDERVVGAGGPLQRFQNTLASIEQTIIERNKTRAYPYKYLLPSQIPNSTNI
jgi:arachidonate 15-lipoxygenase